MMDNSTLFTMATAKEVTNLEKVVLNPEFPRNSHSTVLHARKNPDVLGRVFAEPDEFAPPGLDRNIRFLQGNEYRSRLCEEEGVKEEEHSNASPVREEAPHSEDDERVQLELQALRNA